MRRVAKRQIRDLLGSPELCKESEAHTLKYGYSGAKAYLVSDAEILVVFDDGAGQLFDNEQEFTSFIEMIRKLPTGRQEESGFSVKELNERLAKLEPDDEVAFFEGHPDYLAWWKRLELRIKRELRQGNRESWKSAAIFIGEALRRRRNGTWVQRGDFPVVLGESGEYYFEIFGSVRKALNEGTFSASSLLLGISGMPTREKSWKYVWDPATGLQCITDDQQSKLHE